MKSHGSSAALEARPSAVRERILSTASKLFYKNGVHAVGVDLVVKESGIAKTSLYRHFGSKDELYACAVESFTACNPFVKRVRAKGAPQRTPSPQKLDPVYRAHSVSNHTHY